MLLKRSSEAASEAALRVASLEKEMADKLMAMRDLKKRLQGAVAQQTTEQQQSARWKRKYVTSP